MSSEVSGAGIVAAPLILPAAAAFGAGWLVWQGGKLLVEANRSVDRQIAEKKRQLEEQARQRKLSAIAAHDQLVDMCSQILAQLENSETTGSMAGFAEIEQLKYDLKKICEERIPDDVMQIESATSLGYLKLDKVIHQQRQIAALELSDSKSGLYRGLSVADLMDDLRIAIGAMKIEATVGMDVKAAEPAVLERAKLNESFVTVVNRIMTALAEIVEISSEHGLPESANTWFHSCFNGVDDEIEALRRPTTNNQELKKGIRSLEQRIEKYDLMGVTIEKEIKRMTTLYDVYADAAKALGEKVEKYKSFKSSKEIEEKLNYLKERAQKAEECAKIYRKLGHTAYLCYAWDKELQAMGYSVHTRQKITEMANKKPQHAKLGENKLPFYKWDESELTQLYSITSDCALQVVVNEDGTVSMQTIAEDEGAETVAVQQKHCSDLKKLYAKLRENWFIFYDYEETESAEKVVTVADWRASDDNAWKEDKREIITDQRTQEKTTQAAKKHQ